MGATLFKGTFQDVPAITAAMQGVSGVFLNTFPDMMDPTVEPRDAATIVAAARAAGTVTSIVVSTFFRVNLWEKADPEFPFLTAYSQSKAGAEKVVRESGITYTILRPGWLMHNFIGPATGYSFPEYPSSRVLAVSYPRDYAVGYLDAADVGQFAAAALLDPADFAGKELDLVHEVMTYDEIAKHLSKAIGKEVTVKYRTAEETAAGKKAGIFAIEEQIWGPTASKHAADVKSVADGYGFRLTTFPEFLKREKASPLLISPCRGRIFLTNEFVHRIDVFRAAKLV
ncbi:hypothetical protein C8R43DRAFT_1047698, partial [Mycena crocata]